MTAAEPRWNGDGSYTPTCSICAWEGKARGTRAEAAKAVRSHVASQRHRRAAMVDLGNQLTSENGSPTWRGSLAVDLRNAEERFRSATDHAEDLRVERNALVRRALARGWTHAQIAEATGLTRGRIGQMAQAAA